MLIPDVPYLLDRYERTEAGRLALGSVADKVVRSADVPVLVYRPAGRGTMKTQSSSLVGSRGRLAARARRSAAL